MKKPKVFEIIVATLVLAIFIVAAVFYGGNVFWRPNFAQADLEKVLATEWQNFTKDKPNFQGGLAMQILSPKGDYFIATNLGDKINNSYHFRIASVSKTFTGAAIMLLQQRGLLNINDKITANIPGTQEPYVPNDRFYNVPYKDEITIKMLLMHRAGIFDLSNNDVPVNELSKDRPYTGTGYLNFIESMDPEHTFTFDELVGINAINQLSFFKPDTAYHYSDIGYSMLGKIIERVSKKTYAQFITDELLTPNGLSNTRVIVDGSDRKMPEPFAPGYNWKDGEFADVTISNMSPHVAEGSMISTPWDLANWGKKLFAGEAGLTKQTVAMMMEGQETGEAPGNEYGLGIGTNVDTRGYGHNGAHEGYLTSLIYMPKTGVTYAIFTNSWDLSKGIDSLKEELKMMTRTANKVLQKMGY